MLNMYQLQQNKEFWASQMYCSRMTTLSRISFLIQARHWKQEIPNDVFICPGYCNKMGLSGLKIKKKCLSYSKDQAIRGQRVTRFISWQRSFSCLSGLHMANFLLRPLRKRKGFCPLIPFDKDINSIISQHSTLLYGYIED